MTVTLDLKPEVEERIVAELGTPAPHEPLPYEEWLRMFDEWLHSHDYIKAPPLSDEAISRESIYREREDAQL